MDEFIETRMTKNTKGWKKTGIVAKRRWYANRLCWYVKWIINIFFWNWSNRKKRMIWWSWLWFSIKKSFLRFEKYARQIRSRNFPYKFKNMLKNHHNRYYHHHHFTNKKSCWESSSQTAKSWFIFYLGNHVTIRCAPPKPRP